MLRVCLSICLCVCLCLSVCLFVFVAMCQCKDDVWADTTSVLQAKVRHARLDLQSITLDADFALPDNGFLQLDLVSSSAPPSDVSDPCPRRWVRRRLLHDRGC